MVKPRLIKVPHEAPIYLSNRKESTERNTGNGCNGVICFIRIRSVLRVGLVLRTAPRLMISHVQLLVPAVEAPKVHGDSAGQARVL